MCITVQSALFIKIVNMTFSGETSSVTRSVGRYLYHLIATKSNMKILQHQMGELQFFFSEGFEITQSILDQLLRTVLKVFAYLPENKTESVKRLQSGFDARVNLLVYLTSAILI